MRLTDWALRRPAALTAVVLLVAIWGTLAYLRTPVDLFPDTAPPQAVVVATQAGASAEDMANDVARVLEKELNTLDGVANITSTSRDGVSSVSVEFSYRKGLAQATSAVSNALDRTSGALPADVGRPEVYPVGDATSPVMTLALRPQADSPKDLADVRLLAENPIQDRLLAMDAVGDAEVFGGHQPEVRVEVDRLDATDPPALAVVDVDAILTRRQPRNGVEVVPRDRDACTGVLVKARPLDFGRVGRRVQRRAVGDVLGVQHRVEYHHEADDGDSQHHRADQQRFRAAAAGPCRRQKPARTGRDPRQHRLSAHQAGHWSGSQKWAERRDCHQYHRILDRL